MASMKDFSDLKALRESLKDQERAREVERAERAEREKVAAQEANLFKSVLGGVKPIPKSNRFVPNAPPGINVKVRPAAKPRTQAEDNAAVLLESLSDQFEVDHLLEDDPSLSFSRSGIGSDVVRKLRKGHWPVQD